MIYTLSDTHFAHAEVIDEYDRPFDGVDDMREQLIKRWNMRVSPEDTVYHVGDLTSKGGPAYALYLLERLNGDIVLLDGNHRPIERSEFDNSELPIQKSAKLTLDEYSFYFAHKAEWVADCWDGWKITGHCHDDVESYPFVDPENQTVNVACELVDYQPIAIEELVGILNHERRYERLSDVDSDY